MRDDAAANAIKTQWLGAWPALSGAVVATAYPALSSGVPTLNFDNEQASEPDPPTPWAELYLEHGAEVQETLGRPARWRTNGNAWVVLRWPVASTSDAPNGTTLIYKLAGAVKDALAGKRFASAPGEDGVVTRGGTLRDNGSGGAGVDGRWWILAVAIPFEYYDFR